MNQAIGKVIESTTSIIVIEIEDDSIFENNKLDLQIGKYLQIEDGNHDYVICAIQSIRISETKKYIIQTQPIGIFGDDNFNQGTTILPSPTEKAYIIDDNIMSKMFSQHGEFSLPFGHLAHNKDINLHINGDKFFGKHIAVVGSTGSGKSCTVSRILQDVVGIDDGTNSNNEQQKNAHIILFDVHSEYQSAFMLENNNFNLNLLDVDTLSLPYWLMNSEELESLFIESNEQNSHNQVSQFKKAVILNKEKYNPDKKITYDSPVYFSIEEVFNYISNLNAEVINRENGQEQKPKLIDGNLVENLDEYFDSILKFVSPSTKSGEKANKGSFHGEFNRFLSRLETKINDKRLSFLLKAKKEDGNEYKTEDFEEILKQFLGYLNQSNISIVDLSGIPFEVLSITVSLISRIVFDFSFHYSKLKHESDELNDIPFMIVCEEAHNYIPKSGGAEYKSSKKSIERIAKEGRKYGLSLMVVSQRPSEVSETIFSQCNNFVALRLTNVNDQNYIKSLLPNNANSITDILPTLSAGQCLIVGDATPMPAVVKMKLPNPLPNSESIRFHQEWNKDWIDVTFSAVINKWTKEHN